MADIIFDCPECDHNLVVDKQAAGRVVTCPECGSQIQVPTPDPSEADEVPEPAVEVTLAPDDAAEPVAAPEMATAGAAMEYKVVSMPEGEGEADKLTGDAVEFKLNELAQEGWHLRSATTIPTRNWLGNPKQELLLILDRQI